MAAEVREREGDGYGAVVSSNGLLLDASSLRPCALSEAMRLESASGSGGGAQQIRSSLRLPPSVATLVEELYGEARVELKEGLDLTRPVTSADVQRAHAALAALHAALDAGDQAEVALRSSEFYDAMPCAPPRPPIDSARLARLSELCQLYDDMLELDEVVGGPKAPSTDLVYNALRCRIAPVDPATAEYAKVVGMVEADGSAAEHGLEVESVLELNRRGELERLCSDLPNRRLLFHGAPAPNVFGLLSRGMLPPDVGASKLGVGRRDAGHLGHGLYFSPRFGDSVQYTTPTADGRRYMLACDVALGRTCKLSKRDTTLTAPPAGFDSVAGVPRSHDLHSYGPI